MIKLTQRAQNSYFIGTSTNKSKATWEVTNSMKFNIPKMIARHFNDYFIDSVQSNADNLRIILKQTHHQDYISNLSKLIL